MLRHGLQGLHNSSLILPASKREYPDRDRLRERYDRYSRVA